LYQSAVINILHHISITRTLISTRLANTVASTLEESVFERPLPYPFGKVVFTHAYLDNPTAVAQHIIFRSIAVFSLTGRRIFCIQKIEAICTHPFPLSSNTMANFGTGHNPIHGSDIGPPPPGFFAGNPNLYHSQAYFPGTVSPAQGYGFQVQHMQIPVMDGIQPMMYAHHPYFPNTTWPGSSGPLDHGYPGILLRNHTGGKGMPPGYNYIFPCEHTAIHVFKTTTKPWQSTIWSNDNRSHAKFYVPSTMTTKELMQALGCCNDDAGKNIMYECVEKGNGQWVTGMRFKGDDKDKMKAAISQWGWDKSRTGIPGQKPVVWLWVTSEGI
jgi:hypothetical protein